MNEHETIIDFGTKNIRLSIFNNLSENIFSSDIENLEILESKNSEKSLSTLIRSAEKYLSKHID